MSDSPIRERMFELANAAVGLGAARSNRADYLDLIAPGETAAVASSLAKASGCGLVVRGLWGRLGLDDPRLRAPYVVGSVISTIVAMAHEAAAWRPASQLAYNIATPDVGDVVVFEAPEHVCTVVRVVPGTPVIADDSLWSVDGGQRDAGGAEVVLTRQRVLVRGPNPSAGARPILGWVDLDQLAAKFLPEGAS